MNQSTKSSSKEKSHRWRRALPAWVQVSVLLLVFASGAGVGAVGVSQYMLSRMQYYRANPEVLPGELSAKLQSRMSMSDEQTAKVLAIITLRHGNIASLRDAAAPGILQEFSLMEQEIADSLNPEQRQQWHETADWARKTFLPIDPSARQKKRKLTEFPPPPNRFLCSRQRSIRALLFCGQHTLFRAIANPYGGGNAPEDPIDAPADPLQPDQNTCWASKVPNLNFYYSQLANNRGNSLPLSVGWR